MAGKPLSGKALLALPSLPQLSAFSISALGEPDKITGLRQVIEELQTGNKFSELSEAIENLDDGVYRLTATLPGSRVSRTFIIQSENPQVVDSETVNASYQLITSRQADEMGRLHDENKRLQAELRQAHTMIERLLSSTVAAIAHTAEATSSLTESMAKSAKTWIEEERKVVRSASMPEIVVKTLLSIFGDKAVEKLIAGMDDTTIQNVMKAIDETTLEATPRNE